ncbi:hypothetical protein cypCar_00027840, partial [Cyprinus carpio]
HAEKTSGFPQVFPKNYVVSHYFNESALCNETKIPDSPDVSDFPSVQSSPEGLLSFTSSLFTRWLDLNCAFGEHQCIFPTPSEEDQDNPPLEEEPNVENHEPVDEQQQPETEGETDKRQLDECPTNGYRESLFPGWSHWTFSFLWITSSLIW